MSTSDWFAVLVGGPLVLLAGCYGTYQIWRTDEDEAERPLGKTIGSAGYQASLLPSGVMIGLALVAIIAGQIMDFSRMPGSAIASTLFALILACPALAIFLFLFLRPRFLVPPRLRAQHGWVRAVLDSRRERRSE